MLEALQAWSRREPALASAMGGMWSTTPVARHARHDALFGPPRMFSLYLLRHRTYVWYK